MLVTGIRVNMGTGIMTPIAVITATTATMIHALPALNRSLSVMPILLSRGSLAMNRMTNISNRAIMMVTKVSIKNIEPMAASPAPQHLCTPMPLVRLLSDDMDMST